MRFLDPDEQLGYLVVRVADQVSRAWFAALRRHAINPRQFSTLALLLREPTLSQAELARRVMVTPQSMSDSIAALIDAGLLRRRALEPGRAAKLEVTAQGKTLLNRATPVVETTNQQSFAALTSKERDQLGMLLRKLLSSSAPEREA
jgi:DNA-binding MarR family transcriptional regulator